MKNAVNITYCGVTKNVTEWAKFFGVTKGAISVRMREHGETHEQAITYFANRSPNAARPLVETKTRLNILAEILKELKEINTKLDGSKMKTAKEMSNEELAKFIEKAAPYFEDRFWPEFREAAARLRNLT